MIATAGATAIATSSGALSWSAGVPDGNRLSVEDVLAAVRRIVAAVDLPVSGDVEGGYAATPDGVRAKITRFLQAGIVGVNIEHSSSPDGVLFDIPAQTARIAAARAAADDFSVRCSSTSVPTCSCSRSALDPVALTKRSLALGLTGMPAPTGSSPQARSTPTRSSGWAL
ncbi:hypothetical protein GCM10010464_27250 [Pseudonocardia yunnanensis]